MADQPAAVPFNETPEFREAVAKAAADAVAHALADAMAKRPAIASPEAPASNDPSGVLAGLALALAELTDQGGERKKVSPGEMKRREEARIRMEGLIVAARQDRRRALYRLTSKLFLDESVIDPMWLDPATKKAQATTIELDGVPNDSMVPVNDTARAIHGAFMEMIGDTLMKPVEQADPYITPGGVVINGQAPARREPVGRGQHARVVRPDEDGGTYRQTRILGTIADPVMQTA